MALKKNPKPTFEGTKLFSILAPWSVRGEHQDLHGGVNWMGACEVLHGAPRCLNMMLTLMVSGAGVYVDPLGRWRMKFSRMVTII